MSPESERRETEGSKGTIRVMQLYPRDMNIYGDWGNALVVRQRLRWHGYTPELLEYNVGDKFPEDVDIVLGGGGQDSGQLIIQDDLQSRAGVLTELAEDGAPMLVGSSRPARGR
jgi:CobQ-like glutamine amidotransferase family enzyme